jgi:hypothetical protein
MRRMLLVGAVVALAGVVAGCGGGKKAAGLTKQAYAAAQSKICLLASDQLRELHLEATVSAYKARGDNVLKIEEAAIKKIDALVPPAEIKAAAKLYSDANHVVLADVKAAVSAAKAGDRTKFQQAFAKSNTDNSATYAPAKEIGARSCYP